MDSSAAALEIALDLALIDDMLNQIFSDNAAETGRRASCRNLLYRQRRELLDAVTDVIDESDRNVLIACWYIEHKALWLQWNLTMNYRMMLKQTFDAVLAERASAVSFLLGCVEPLIDPESLVRINELLEQPIVAPAL
jgi:hypothetical protein